VRVSEPTELSGVSEDLGHKKELDAQLQANFREKLFPTEAVVDKNLRHVLVLLGVWLESLVDDALRETVVVRHRVDHLLKEHSHHHRPTPKSSPTLGSAYLSGQIPVSLSTGL